MFGMGHGWEIVTIMLIVLWLYPLAHCLLSKKLTGNGKALWALVIIVGNWIGRLAYLLVTHLLPALQRLQRV